MKRFSVMLLALVFVVAFTVPAMAATPDGGLSVSGTYKIDGESNNSNTGATKRWYDDDFELIIRATQGDVTATVDLEISDNANFTPLPTTIERSGDIVDNYYIQWKANDALALKIGEYGVSFGTHEGYYSQGHEQIGITYALDAVTFGLNLAKLEEGGTKDINQYTLAANFKDVGTFTKLNFIYGTYADGIATGNDKTFMGLEFAVPAGPVALSGEYGADGGDTADGSYYLLSIGLTDLINMDKLGLSFNYFNAGEDYTSSFASGDYDPMAIYGAKYNDKVQDVTLYWFSGTYAYSDKLGLNFKIGSGSEGSGSHFLAGTPPTTQASVDGSIGTEIDFGGSYKLADNVTYQASFATWSPGSDFAPSDDTFTKLFNRLTFKF